jgi:hypothetical protein
VTVTPRLVAPEGPKTKEMLDRARKSYQDAADSLSFSLFD